MVAVGRARRVEQRVELRQVLVGHRGRDEVAAVRERVERSRRARVAVDPRLAAAARRRRQRSSSSVSREGGVASSERSTSRPNTTSSTWRVVVWYC